MTESEVQKLIDAAIQRERKLMSEALERRLLDNDPNSIIDSNEVLFDLLHALQRPM